MPDLFSPLDLGDVTVPNRLFVSPMCQYSCHDRDGRATDWHLVHLGSRAVGGAGAVVAEATAVEARGRISPEDLGIWSEDHVEALKPVAAFIKEQGSVPVVQLAHAGRKASRSRPWDETGLLQPEDDGWVTVGPSHPYPTDDDDGVAFRALTTAEISDIVTAFADAAQRAAMAGFEAVEIHAAHGYLLHQFLSPVANDREDAYGGDFESRTRFLREVLAAVQERVPDLSLWVRVSGTDWLPDRDAWDIDQTCRLAKSLSDLGVDLIDVSSGGIHPDQSLPWSGPSYQVELAEAVREAVSTNLAVATVGGFTAAEQADAAIRTGRADVVAVARQFLREPYFGLHAAETLDAEDRNPPPDQYHSAF